MPFIHFNSMMTTEHHRIPIASMLCPLLVGFLLCRPTHASPAHARNYSTAAFASLRAASSSSAAGAFLNSRIRPAFGRYGIGIDVDAHHHYRLRRHHPLYIGTKEAGGSADENDDKTFDFLVIGAGSGGIASARRAASYGAKVAIVERSRLGGTCVNVGCVPKKVMWNAAEIAETLEHMHQYGFSSFGGTELDWKFLKDARDAYILRLNGIYDRNIANSGITTIAGTASFAPGNADGDADGPVKVVVTPDDGGSGSAVEYSARHVLIATGGRPVFPDAPGVKEHCISSDGFFDLQELPEKAVVVGAGYIAVELAGVLQSLGSDTSLVLRKERALREFDEMISESLDEEMKKNGISVYCKTDGVASVTANDDGKKTVHLQNGETIADVDVCIMAIGREPLVEPLNLDSAGVELQDGAKKYIDVNEYCETSRAGVFALGDVIGEVELTPTAIAAGRRLADRLYGGPEFANAKISYENVPTVVFSHPPIGTVGLSEKQAVEKYGEDNLKIYRSKFANLQYGIWDVEPEDKPKTSMKLGETFPVNRRILLVATRLLKMVYPYS